MRKKIEELPVSFGKARHALISQGAPIVAGLEAVVEGIDRARVIVTDGLALAELLERREHGDNAGDARLQDRKPGIRRLLDRVHRSVKVARLRD